jgi:hypothetical protein
MSRTATVTVVALMLVLASVPAAHALSFGSSGPSLAGSGWLDAALSWLSQILFGQPPASQALAPAFAASNSTDYNHPMTGSCIDPEGRPRPCAGL